MQNTDILQNTHGFFLKIVLFLTWDARVTLEGISDEQDYATPHCNRLQTVDYSCLILNVIYAEPFAIPGMTAEREMILGGRYLREVLSGGDGAPMREASMGYNRLNGRFELVKVDSLEPGQMVYLGREGDAESSVSMFGVSTEAGMGAEPTGRKRDLRFEFVIEDPRHLRWPRAAVSERTRPA